MFGKKRLHIPSNLVCFNITGEDSKLDLVGGLMNKLVFYLFRRILSDPLMKLV